MSFPVTRPSGRALLVGNPAGRGETIAILAGLGYECDGVDDPYAAMAELCQRAGGYSSVVLSLMALYKEELEVIRTIKRRMPEIDVWLTQIDGRHAAMIAAISLGADGLLSEDGLHRVGLPAAATPARQINGATVSKPNGDSSTAVNGNRRSSNGMQHLGKAFTNGSNGNDHHSSEEPLLSPEEMRALLQEQPFLETQDEAPL